MTAAMSAHGIGARELTELSIPLVTQHSFDVPQAHHRSALLTGYMKVTELEPGMRLRVVDVHDHFGLTSRAELPPGVKIALVMGGTARIRYAHQWTELGPASKSAGLVVMMPSPESFARQGRPGGHEQTVTLSLSPHWLRHHGMGNLLAAGNGTKAHLCHWSPSEDLLIAARKLFNTSQVSDNTLEHMALTGFAFSLTAEALQHAQASKAPLPDVAGRDKSAKDRRLLKLMILVDGGQARHATQEDLARYLGMSLSNLQRQFRTQFGEALGHYLRRYHLGLAWNALKQDRISIEAAADIAGYASAPNFATAFRKEFGITPSDCRASGSPKVLSDSLRSTVQ